MKTNIFILLAFILLSSCDSYLDDPIDKTDQREIESTDDINLILNNVVDGMLEGPSNYYLTDNYSISPSTFMAVQVYGLGYADIQNYVWNDDLSQTENDSWTKAYESIWQANYIINNVDGLEGDQEEKDNLKAEAHLIKAEKYLSMAITHCLYPSDANASELGLPIKNTTEFGQNTVRADLANTKDEIEANIVEGLKIDKEREFSWRESSASAAALAARYYLYVHDFTNAEKYAKEALTAYSRMINMEYEVLMFPYFADVTYPSTGFNFELAANYFTGWESQYKYGMVKSYFFLPSQELTDLFDANDLRLQKFFEPNYMKYVGAFGVTQYVQFSSSVAAGPDVAEMYLILAECEARNENYAACMQNVEAVRSARFNAADYTVLPIPASVKEAVQLVVDERRREKPFSLRWYDIKRLNAEGLLDPIVVRRDFVALGENTIDLNTPQQYVLEVNSRKYARPIPKEVIELTGGTVEQNTY